MSIPYAQYQTWQVKVTEWGQRRMIRVQAHTSHEAHNTAMIKDGVSKAWAIWPITL